MLSATLFTLALHSTGAPVSVTIEPMPLRKAVPELAAATGMRLAVSEVLADEVVQVRVTDVEPDALLRHVADVVGGTWTSDASGARRLVEDTAVTADLKRKALQARTKRIADELAALVQQLEAQPEPQFEPPGLRRGPDGEVELRIEGGRSPFANLPGGRAVLRALRAISPADLAAIGDGKRVVYTSNPTAMQRRLPGLPLRDAATFLAEEQKMASLRPNRARGRGGAAPPPPDEQGPPAVPAKVFLILHRTRDVLEARLVVADQQGKSLASGFMTLGMDAMLQQWVRGPAQGRPEPAAPGDGPAYSEEAVAAAKALSARPGADSLFVASLGPANDAVIVVESEGAGAEAAGSEKPPLVEHLFDPGTHEPLGLFAGEAVSRAAADADLVACIPDSALAPLATHVATGRGAAEGDSLPYVIERADGWAVVRPRDILRARAERADRRALDALGDRIKADGILRLGPLAKYALTAPEFSGGLDTALVRALDPTAPRRFADVYGDGRAALRAFARLQGPDFAALESGMTRAVASLGGPTLGVVDMVYHSRNGPDVAREQPSALTSANVRLDFAVSVSGLVESQLPGPFRIGQSDMRDERTEVLPSGIPGGTSLSMATNRLEALYAFDPNTGAARFTTAGRLGAEAGLSELLPERARRNSSAERYLPTTQTEYVLTFLLAPGVSMTHRLLDPSKADLRQAMAVGDFTGKLAEEYNKAYQQSKERSSRMGERRRGNTPPPTP